MKKMPCVEPESANEKVRMLLAEAQERTGMIPNALRVLANSPAALEMALRCEDILAEGGLSERLREQIALRVSQLNQSGYCIAAHRALAGIAGLSEEEIADARSGVSPDRRTESALAFVQELWEGRGGLHRTGLGQMRSIGWNDGEIVEIIVQVGLTTLFNYLNRVAGTEADFPLPPGEETSGFDESGSAAARTINREERR
jgi:uncharacterized peroxidase-related enzyme